MKSFFKLVRYKNLIMIALLQYLMRYCFILPVLKGYNLSSCFGALDFFFLVLASVLIAAGGYAINDWFDIKTDMINRPDKVLIDNEITRSSAAGIHLWFSGIGSVLGFLVSFRTGVWIMGLIFPLAAGFLWFYSSTYKKQFLLGNIIIALLSATIPLLPAAYETPCQIAQNRDFILGHQLDIYIFIKWASAFAIFAFLTTFIRELIKDTEDFEGDNQIGRRTLPIVLGEKITKIIAVAFTCSEIILLVSVWLLIMKDIVSGVYFVVALILPMIFAIFKIIKASSKSDFHSVSNLYKIIMLAGILFLVVVKIELELL